MSRLIKINSCPECPFSILHLNIKNPEAGIKYRCQHPEVVTKKDKTRKVPRTKIPNWCPLGKVVEVSQIQVWEHDSISETLVVEWPSHDALIPSLPRDPIVVVNGVPYGPVE